MLQNFDIEGAGEGNLFEGRVWARIFWKVSLNHTGLKTENIHCSYERKGGVMDVLEEELDLRSGTSECGLCGGISSSVRTLDRCP